jgi:hypothetical protein
LALCRAFWLHGKALFCRSACPRLICVLLGPNKADGPMS